MKKVIAFLSLFTSVGTLVCCALPALFVVLGFGAAFAGLVTVFPGLIWISERKVWFFGFGMAMLIAGGSLQIMNRQTECPVDKFGNACETTRDWSKGAYLISIIFYGVGFFFSFIAPRIFE